MHGLLAFLLIVLALPPCSVAMAGYLFFVPLLLSFERFSARPWLAASEAFVFGAGIGAYAYLGAYAEGLLVYALCILVPAVVFGVGGFISALVLSSGSMIRALCLVPILWVVAERLINLTGLPFAFALTLDDALIPLQLASLGGPSLVTLYLLLVPTAAIGVARLVGRRAWLPASALASALLVLNAGVFAYGHTRVVRFDPAPVATPRVAVAQTNLPPQLLQQSPSRGRLEHIVGQHRVLERRLRRLAGKDGLTAVWPESAIPGLRLRVNNDTRATKTGFRSVLHNYGLSSQAELVSEVQVVDERGRTTARTRKVSPVPFAEQDIKPGRQTQLLTDSNTPFGALICYESSFPDLSRTLVSQGARWLAVLTNDAFEWPSYLMHFNYGLGRLRAIENAVTVARSANGGRSTLFAPSGKVRAEVEAYGIGIATAHTDRPHHQTLYTRHGHTIDAIVEVGGALLIACLLLSYARVRTRRRDARQPICFARYLAGVTVAALVISAVTAWQFQSMANSHRATVIAGSNRDAGPTRQSALGAALEHVHRRYGFLVSRKHMPDSLDTLGPWARAHGLRSNPGTLKDNDPALRFAMAGLIPLDSGDIGVVIGRRNQIFHLYLPNRRAYRWIHVRRLEPMQRGPIIWLKPALDMHDLEDGNGNPTIVKRNVTG